MPSTERDAVTGAFSYTGRYIARRLLAAGRRVITLTGHPGRPDPFGGAVPAAALDFHDPAALARSLRSVAVLYNTYWVRFPWPPGGVTYERAVADTKRLLAAAQEAGVRRVVHISIANASPDSPLPYYRGKAELEQALRDSGLGYAILRPTVLFGGEQPAEDVLINNIAWLLRRLPVFAIPGDGLYRIQPVHVDDLAALAVEAGGMAGNVARDAAGPETYRFEELVRLVARQVGSRARFVHLPPRPALLLAQSIGALVGDVLLTADEVRGLMAGLLASREPPAGRTRFSEWLAAHRGLLGAVYASELERHYR